MNHDPTRRPDRPILDYLQRFYYDCISFHWPALRAAIDTVGVDHLVFGTDFPFDEEDTRTIVSDVEAVVPGEANRELVMRSTAHDLFEL